MRNKFQIRGTITAIFLRHKDSVLETLIDTSDLPLAQSFPFTWCVVWNAAGKTFYVYGNNKGSTVYLHRWILQPPKRREVDHDDYNGLNNLRSNISIVTHSKNLLKRRMQVNNTSGHPGVFWDKEKSMWIARVKVNRKQIYLGRFSNKSVAVQNVESFRESLIK